MSREFKLIMFLVILFSLFIPILYTIENYMINKRVIENIDNFEVYNTCYQVDNKYYCR